MKRIYVGNLSYKATDDDLRALFNMYGEVSEATIIMDKETGRSKGFGFVAIDNDAELGEMLRLDGAEHMGRKIKVTEARPREKSKVRS